MAELQKEYRKLVKMDELLENDKLRPLALEIGHEALKGLLQKQLQEDRLKIKEGLPCPSKDEIISSALMAWERLKSFKLRKVINGTGVLLHTNLGRSPLGHEVIEAIKESSHYCNLELDLILGKRRRRGIWAEKLICLHTAAEDAHIVNNNAAAVLLCLSILPKGSEVLVSRGELIEIGGGFRLPDIFNGSGVVLREVGTSNCTRPEDYEKAINENTRAVLSVHKSNFSLSGYYKEPCIKDLKEFTKKNKLLFIKDLGCGLSEDTGIEGGLSVQKCVSQGFDLICFSSDKLFGGPQAGIAIGSSFWVEKLRKAPMTRALRPDKLIIAALESVVSKKLKGPGHDNLLEKLMSRPKNDLLIMGERVLKELSESSAGLSLIDSVAKVGGGTLPDYEMDSVALCFKGHKASLLDKRLRLADPPVYGRIAEGEFLIDLKAIIDEDTALLIASIKNSLKGTINA